MPYSGGYTLDLYCECAECAKDTRLAYDQAYCEYNNLKCGYAQFYGETFPEAAKEARAYGWYISRDRQTIIAPGHKR